MTEWVQLVFGVSGTSGSSDLSAGALVGIIAGSVVGIALAIAAIFFLAKKGPTRKKKLREQKCSGGIALICLGALLAGAFAMRRVHESHVIRAKTPSVPLLDVADDGVLVFANEQLLAAANSNDLAATNSELLAETPSNRRHLTGGSGSGSGSGSDAPTSAPTGSPTTSTPTSTPVAAPTASPTTPTPTASPTTSSPTSAPTSPGPSYSQTDTDNVEVVQTVDTDYSSAPTNLASEAAYAYCTAVGNLPGVGWENWRHTNCQGTQAAGSTVLTIVIFAGGATVTQIQTFTGTLTATTAATILNGLGLGTYTVLSISTETTTYSTSSSGLSTGALVGIIVGSIVGVALIGAVIFLVVKKGGSPKGSTAPEY
jgi:hypothetical protein